MKLLISYLNTTTRIFLLSIFLLVFSLDGYTQLTGNYTIDPAGGAFPNFVSFQAAIDSLHTQGVSTAVTFDIADGVYNERVTINQISGASAANRITFQSASDDSTSATITSNSPDNIANWTLRLNGADYITIRKIRIEATNSTYCRAININSSANYNIIENCQLDAVYCNSNTYAEVIASFDDKAQHNIIRNNYIRKGTHGIFMEGTGLSDPSYGTQIIGNTFIEQTENAIELAEQYNPRIEGNSISSSDGNLNGITVRGADGPFKVIKNRIYFPEGGTGIYYYRNTGSVSENSLTENNMITIGGNSDAKGIYIRTCEYVNIFHNSINITSTGTYVGAIYQNDAFTSYGYSKNIVMKNNVFVNSGGGYACYVRHSWVFTESDYNIWYTTGATLALWDGDKAGLEDLQIQSQMDEHSLSIDPVFATSTNLLPDNWWLDGKADPASLTTSDIDGNLRQSPPDIGAFEFVASNAPLASGTYTIGGSSPDYGTVGEALDDLDLLGIAGSVTFVVRDGAYNECPGQIGQILGTSASDTVVLKSESGNSTIHFANDETVNRAIIKLNGTDHFTLMDLTITSTGASFGRAIQVRGRCKNLNIINNTLACNNSADEVLTIWGGVINDITIRNNYFSKGRRGMLVYSNQDVEYGNNILIEDNTIVDAQEAGIMIRYHIAPIIRNNTVTNSDDMNNYGIWARDCEQELEITGNRISLNSGGYGIRLGNCDAVLPFKGLMANNMVHVGGGAVNSYGIQVDESNRQDILYNSVHVSSADPNKGRTIYSEDGNEELRIINNIFANSGGGYAMFVNDAADITTSDNNGFYNAGSNLASWDGTQYATLGTLQGVSGQDASSLVAEPLFYSDTDLRTLQKLFHKAAQPLSEVTYDIDSVERDPVTPDIGAMEFSCGEPEFNVFIAPVCFGDTTLIIDSTEFIAPGSSRGWDLDGIPGADIFTENQYDTITWVFDQPVNTIGYIVQQIAGCNSYETFDASVIPAPVLEIETKGAYCDVDDGWAEVSVTNIEGPFTYNWSTGSTDNVASDLALGTVVTVAVSDETGCTATGDTIIGEAIVVAVTELSPSTCGIHDGSAMVSATGGIAPYTYVWSNGYTAATNDSLAPGPHYVNVIDNEGCYAQGSINITSDGGPKITRTGWNDNDCYGEKTGSIDISISSGVSPYNILWSNGETTEDIENLAAGTYNVVVEDSEGCMGAGSFQVFQPARISISPVITPSTCEGSDGKAVAVVSGGFKPYAYQWSTGGIYQIEEGLAAGVYSVTVLDGKGCEMLEPVIVSNIDAPEVIITDVQGIGCTVIDNGSITAITAEFNPFDTYSWSSGQSTPTITNLTEGTYVVTVTDENGCAGVNQAVIEQVPPAVNPICIVSVDTLTSKNIIIWEKQYTEDVSHYNLYRESSVKGLYQLIDTINIGSESSYIDAVADPSIRSWRYKLSVVDVCGIESELSPHHKTMHLTMNLGVGGVVNLIWDHYEGFPVTTYKIWRYDADSDWVNIADVPSNLTSYTDQNPPEKDLTYFIEVLHSGGCEASEKKPAKLNSSRSNRKSSKKSTSSTEILEELMNISQFNIYPNPGEGIYKLELEKESLNKATIKIFDVSGKTLLTREYKEIRGRLETEIDLSGYADGLYHIQIVTGSAILHRILIKE